MQHSDLVMQYLAQTKLGWVEMPNQVAFLRKTGRNWLYRLDVKGVPTYILKLYKGNAWHKSEREALALTKLQELGFSAIPQIVHHQAAVPLFDGRSVLIYNYLPGEPLAASDLTQGRSQQLVYLISKLYQYPATGELLHLGKPHAMSRYWQELEQTLAKAKPDPVYQPLLKQLHQLAREHITHFPLLQVNPPATLLHGDLNLSNFILSPDGSLKLIDWELFAMGDPAIDLAWFFFLNRFELVHQQKETLLDLWRDYDADLALAALQFYPLLQLRYLLLIIEGLAKWRSKPHSRPMFAPFMANAREMWLLRSLSNLKTDFESFQGEQGLQAIENTLTPMPFLLEHATPPSPSYLIQRHNTKTLTARAGLQLSFLNGAYDGLSRVLPTPERYKILPLTIGRDDSCDICISYDTQLSRQHARLIFENGESSYKCWLEDLESRNGTFLQEQRLGRGTWELQPGQPFRVGHSFLQLDLYPLHHEQDALLQRFPAVGENFAPDSMNERLFSVVGEKFAQEIQTEYANAALLNSLDELTRTILSGSEAEARKQGASWLGVEHLFISLSRQDKEATINLLKQLKLDPAEFRAKLRLLGGGQGQNSAPQSTLAVTPRLQRVLVRAAQLIAIAKEGKGSLSQTTKTTKLRSQIHRFLLAALLEDANSLPARLLLSEGGDLTRIVAHLS